MVKTVALGVALTLWLWGQEPSVMVEKNCLSCHKAHAIPSELIYRRYLLRYSTHEAMKQAIVSYLSNPNPKNSIMPSPFFVKFPMKQSSTLDKPTLLRSTEEFLDYFDIKKRFSSGSY